MKAALAIALLLVLPPLALADQSVSQGPASARTTNASSGDGACDAGSNGSETRDANARVQLTDQESLFVDVYSSCYANSWNDGRGNWDNWTSSSTGFSAGRQTGSSWGPYAAGGFYDSNDTASWGTNHWCGSNVYFAGPALNLGCWPNGERPPMLPMLP